MKHLPIPICLLLILVIGISACQPGATQIPAAQQAVTPSVTTPASDWKLVAIFPGVVTDADYNTLGYMGINEVSRELNIETTYEESVAVSQVDSILREYISDGYNIIWAHGGQYVNSMVDLAAHFPEIVFIAEGDEPASNPPANLWFIDRNFEVGFYLIGATAALSTRSGKIGYLGGERLPFTYAEVHAARQAIQDLGLNGKVELIPVWVGDFNDPMKASDLTEELIEQGVDFIMGSLNLGMFGAFEAVKAVPYPRVLITAKYMDKSGFAPDNYVTSLLYDFTTPLKDIIQHIMAGKIGGYYSLDFDTGKSLQLPLLNLEPRVEVRVNTLRDQVMNGTIQVIQDTSPLP
jgi:basic membrane protein A and related proteins